MELTDEMVQNKYVEGMSAYNSFMLEMVSRSGKILDFTPTSEDKWQRQDGFSNMKIQSNNGSFDMLVYIPAKGSVPHHNHPNLDEIISMLSGKVCYEIYTNKKCDVIIGKGTLKKGDVLTINRLDYHYVFTAEKNDALILIEFYRVKE